MNNKNRKYSNNYVMKNLDHLEQKNRKNIMNNQLISNEDMFKLNCAKHMFNQTNLL